MRELTPANHYNKGSQTTSNHNGLHLHAYDNHNVIMPSGDTATYTCLQSYPCPVQRSAIAVSNDAAGSRTSVARLIHEDEDLQDKPMYSNVDNYELLTRAVMSQEVYSCA